MLKTLISVGKKTATWKPHQLHGNRSSKGRQMYWYCSTFAFRFTDTQYGLSSEFDDKWFINVQKTTRFLLLSFSRHQLSLAFCVTYDIANVNLSVYYAIFNHKFDGIYHVFFAHFFAFFLLTAMVFHAKWQYNLLFDFKIMHVFEFINPSQGFPVQRQMSAIFMSKSSKIKIQKQLCSNCHVAFSK